MGDDNNTEFETPSTRDNNTVYNGDNNNNTCLLTTTTTGMDTLQQQLRVEAGYNNNVGYY